MVKSVLKCRFLNYWRYQSYYSTYWNVCHWKPRFYFKLSYLLDIKTIFFLDANETLLYKCSYGLYNFISVISHKRSNEKSYSELHKTYTKKHILYIHWFLFTATNRSDISILKISDTEGNSDTPPIFIS